MYVASTINVLYSGTGWFLGHGGRCSAVVSDSILVWEEQDADRQASGSRHFHNIDPYKSQM